MTVPGDGADAAAIHLYPASGPFGCPDVHEIEPQGAAGGDILNKAAAAVDIELGLVHGQTPGKEGCAADRPDPIGQPGAGRVFGENRDGHVLVNGAHLLKD